MFDTTSEILDQLRAGEDGRAEFKEVRLGKHSVIDPNSEEMAGELVALANADGGVVFLGVDDDGIVRGIPEAWVTKVEEWTVNIATENCDPPIRPLIRKERLPQPGKETGDALILLVEVHRGLYVHQTSTGRAYIRVGSTKRVLKSYELGRLLQDRGRFFVFDEQPVFDATRDDLDEKSLTRFFGPTVSIPWDDLLRNMSIVVKDEEGIDRPTVAGILTFGKEPSRFLPSALITAAIYSGEERTSDDLVHSQVIDGRIDEQIDEATSFVERFMLRPARKPRGREDYPQYAMGAVHEAIVNAVAHRDYSIRGSKIRLFLFLDRLEILSPGSLPNTLTVEQMRYRQFTRNQLLVALLSKMKSRRTGHAFIESRGEGVPRILEESEHHSGREPRYDLIGDELCLTIWAKPSPHVHVEEA